MARRLDDGLWQFDLGLFTPLASNAFLVDDSVTPEASRAVRAVKPRVDGEGRPVSGFQPREDSAVTLVDTGLPVNAPSVASELTDAGYAVADIDRVLLTHYDLDHVGGLARLDGLDAEVYMGAADVDLVRGDWHPKWGHHKGAFHRLARQFFSMSDYDLRAVSDGDGIGAFTAFHTPGHNPGHTVYVHEGVDAAFLGDLVWEDDGEFTIPFWLDSYNMREIRRSVRDFTDRMPDFERGLASHGDPILDGGDEALRALAARLE